MSIVLGINAKQIKWNVNPLAVQIFLEGRNKTKQTATTFVFLTKEDIFFSKFEILIEKR